MNLEEYKKHVIEINNNIENLLKNNLMEKMIKKYCNNVQKQQSIFEYT